MESEKVKEIKECLEEFKDDRIGYYTNGLDRFMLTKEDILILINELESENERLKTSEFNSCQELDNVSTQIHILEKKIAELEKENARLDKVVKHNQKLIEDGKLISNEQLKQFAEKVKMEFYYQFDEIIPSIMAGKIDKILKEFLGE